MRDQIRSKFSHHTVGERGIKNMVTIRCLSRLLANEIDVACPPGAEKESAIDHLQTAMFKANAAIASIEPIDLRDQAGEFPTEELLKNCGGLA